MVNTEIKRNVTDNEFFKEVLEDKEDLRRRLFVVYKRNVAKTRQIRNYMLAIDPGLLLRGNWRGVIEGNKLYAIKSLLFKEFQESLRKD